MFLTKVGKYYIMTVPFKKANRRCLLSLEQTIVDSKVRAWFKLFRLLVRVPVP
jgi:hypothetical protein